MTPRRHMPALLLLFVGSGCAALIYEIVWFQLLQLVIGSSAISLGVLLGTFMGGMSLGSLLLPRFIGAEQHPLRIYAYLEIGIGAHRPADPVRDAALQQRLYGHRHGTGIVGLVCAASRRRSCLLPPTLLMGATLPAISRWVKATPGRDVAWLGYFYGGNIAGGVLGCLLAGFYLLRVHDMAIATYVAVALNILVGGLIAIMLAGRDGRTTPRRPSRWSRRIAPGAWAVYVRSGSRA
jgi:spermidine synthase